VPLVLNQNNTNEQSSNNGKYLRYARDAKYKSLEFDIEIEVDIVSAHRTPEIIRFQ
jgi:phosphoribosylcarboxyaminoimidazole (NCAIR) mutase